MNALCSEAAVAKAAAATLTTPCRRAVLLIERIRNAYGQVYAVLSYEPDKNYLLMKWSGFCTEEEVKAASLRMLDWQRTQGRAKGCKFHVHDTNEIESAWAGLVDWINNELFPDCFQAGLRYNVVFSPRIFSPGYLPGPLPETERKSTHRAVRDAFPGRTLDRPEVQGM
jgi:hypothetical protein